MSLKGVRKAVLDVEPYVPGKTTEEVICEKGLTSVVKLGSNENPYGPFPSALEAMKDELVRLNTYPDVSFGEIKKAISGLYGLEAANVCISHGAEGMLQTLARTFIEKGDRILLPGATYSLYREISKLMGADIVDVPMKDSFYIDMEALIEALTPETRLIWLNNPNNPTGTIFDSTLLEKLLDKIPESCWVVLDEAYAEFADPLKMPDTGALIRAGYNVISVRTFSKAYGLAGARIGYALCREEMAVIIDTVSEPFNANRVGIAGALATLRKDREASLSAIQKIKDERRRIIDSLSEMGLDPLPSETNFVFFSTPFSAKDLSEALLEKGVIVRPCSGWGYSRSIRVTVGTPEENSVFLCSITSALDEMRKDDRF